VAGIATGAGAETVTEAIVNVRVTVTIAEVIGTDATTDATTGTATMIAVSAVPLVSFCDFLVSIRLIWCVGLCTCFLMLRAMTLKRHLLVFPLRYDSSI
jgi:hypothetical protein